MVLRGLQSFGCSATVAISYGVVADVATPTIRGSILGPAMIATNLGPSIGPLVGGLLVARAGWRWTFWLLVIVGVAFLVILGTLLPETGRNVIGNGSVAAPKWDRPLLQTRKQHEQVAPVDEEVWRKRELLPNPFKALLYASISIPPWYFPIAPSTTPRIIAFKPRYRLSSLNSTG
jgi:MFS family permease